tara:strand:- start:735 stop:872 length:138 start_codon:yes stop_codon:yes gene_type:complete
MGLGVKNLLTTTRGAKQTTVPVVASKFDLVTRLCLAGRGSALITS